MTAQQKETGTLSPAACPLLAAVMPLRYAIGPTLAVDTSAYDLPALTGSFPDLGKDAPLIGERSLNYTARLLRDGWLYVWQPGQNRLLEYRVTQANLAQTPRAGRVIDTRSLPYLLLPAGEPAMLAWSPSQWSEAQFSAAKAKTDVRQRVMREITPGAAPFSGKASGIHERIGDYMDAQHYAWSCEPSTQHRPSWPRLLDDMQRCEQQAYALIDDPWGVLLDLAGLMRARGLAYDKLCAEKRDDWAVATVLKSLSESDKQVREQLPDITDHTRLKRTWQEQEQAAKTHELDARRLAELWVSWFETLGRQGPATLETACGHFDITQSAARELLETYFAAACLGPSANGASIKAIEAALDLDTSANGKPWLVWSVLGVAKRLTPGEIKQALHVVENLQPVEADLLQAGERALHYGERMVRALTLAAAINLGADQLEELTLAKISEPLAAVFAPIMGGRMPSLTQQVNHASMVLLKAFLARSAQRLDVLAMSPRQSLEWLSSLYQGAHNKGQKRRLQKEIERLRQKEQRLARQAAMTPASPKSAILAEHIEEATPHLRIVPKPQPAPPHPQPGYGSDVPPSPPAKAPVPSAPPSIREPDLVPLRGQDRSISMPKSFANVLEEAPLKSLIALAAVWNLYQVNETYQRQETGKSRVARISAMFAAGTAVSALVQKVAEVKWERHALTAGKQNSGAQKLLADALGVGARTMLFQAVTAGIDTVYFGWEALDSFQAGDMDSAATQAGISAANLAMMRLSVQMFRALRVARAAVIVGQATALGRGVSAIPAPLLAQAAGLTITILGGLVALLYTKDTPLESWVKQTRFGTYPADWAVAYEQSMMAYYQMVLPVEVAIHRWTDINPMTGDWVNEIRLILLLPGQAAYRQGMVSFDGHEEWELDRGLLSFSESISKPLRWDEDDPIPLYEDTGTRVTPEPGGVLRLSCAYHNSETLSFQGIKGALTYQPIDGLYLPSINIDES
ncbi:MAG: toxin VasX [Pseudomonas sp.]|uniref:toxin VasX n=1 Tax=Pseudomonas sp. TaxID=306 RepID=UPI00299D82ED|nr:toxin VasX [Pseudomonas sp.]MDX1723965.1 toxin VasX [Pseudomonas sp.]